MEGQQQEVKLPYFLEWVLKNKNITLGAVLALFVLTFFLFRSSGEMPYFEAEKFSSLWKDKKEEKYFDKLNLFVKQNSSLKSKYQSVFTDKYLMNKDLVSATKSFADSSYFLKELFPFHDDFSRTSLLVEKGKIKEALNKSIALQERMKKANLENTLLYEYNLLRLALLHQRLGSGAEELLVYESMKNQGKKLPISEKEITFSDYIDHRKTMLRN